MQSEKNLPEKNCLKRAECVRTVYFSILSPIDKVNKGDPKKNALFKGTHESIPEGSIAVTENTARSAPGASLEAVYFSVVSRASRVYETIITELTLPPCEYAHCVLRIHGPCESFELSAELRVDGGRPKLVQRNGP